MNAFHHELATAIGHATGLPFVVSDAQAVHGGDISQALKLSDGVRSVFVKIQPAAGLAMFETEAAGLAELAAANAVRVPQVICHGMAAGQAYLVLDYLSLSARGDAVLLGRQLAQQHRVSAAWFGWTRDNWIGATPQPNAWHDDWIGFWCTQRLGFQLRRAAENGHTGALQRDGEALLTRLDAFFGGYAFFAGFLLALPVGFLLLCLNLIVGMLSRSAPALNLFAVGLPASLAVGVIAMAIAFPAMGDYMVVIVNEGLSAAQKLVLG